MPCDVLAYRRFSILRLQLRQRKQDAQKAWSPVRMAKSSILLPHVLQLYVQLLQMSEPSPSNRRLASESRRVPQVLHRKQSMCHLLPAVRMLAGVDKYNSASVRTRMGKSLPSSNALPSSRICTVVSSAISRLRMNDLPLRSLCMGTRHRLAPWATLGKCPETPLPKPSHKNSGIVRWWTPLGFEMVRSE